MNDLDAEGREGEEEEKRFLSARFSLAGPEPKWREGTAQGPRFMMAFLILFFIFF